MTTKKSNTLLMMMLTLIITAIPATMVNRFAASKVGFLRTVIGQALLALVGIGSFASLKGSKEKSYKILAWAALAMGYTSITQLIHYAGLKIAAKQSVAIAAGENENKLMAAIAQASQQTALSGSRGSSKGLGNVELFFKRNAQMATLPSDSRLIAQASSYVTPTGSNRIPVNVSKN